MWIIRKEYAALKFYQVFPNSLVILDKYFSHWTQIIKYCTHYYLYCIKFNTYGIY